jgi:tetratricopeptide (TPR) repeat protein
MLAAVVLLLLTAAGMAAAETRWVRLRSPHFELFSDAGAGSGREVLRRMEQIRHVFETRTQRQNLTPLPIRIFVFRSDADFQQFQINENAAGYYQAGTSRDYIAMQVAGVDLYRVVFHEYAHLLMRHAGVPIPVWFNEGTAEVYSTTELSGREIRIGEPIPTHLATLRAEHLLDLPALLSVDHQSPHYNERDKTGVFYAESWALVHMLNFSPAYQPGMPNFLAMLFSGEEPSRAMQQAFGKSPAAILADLENYVRRDRFSGIRFAAPRLEGIGKVPSEQVSEVDSGLALADLLLAISRPDQSDTLLQKLASTHPESSAIEAALGDVAVQKKQDQLARTHYERAMKLGDRSGRLRYDYAMVLREMNASDDQIIIALRDAVRLDPALFDARYLLGYMLLKTGEYTEAVEHLESASEMQPGRCAVWEHLALALHYSGKNEEARAAAQKARKTAVTAEDVNRAEGTLRLLEANADPIVRAEPLPTRARQQSLAESSAAVKTEGLLTQVDCLGSRARLHLVANGRKLFLLVRDAGSVVLRNAGGVWTEFTCGPVPGRKVIVEYRRVANQTYGTAGDVAAIEFR